MGFFFFFFGRWRGGGGSRPVAGQVTGEPRCGWLPNAANNKKVAGRVVEKKKKMRGRRKEQEGVHLHREIEQGVS